MEEAREVVWPDVEWRIVRDPKGKDDWGYALGVLGSPWALLIPAHLAVTPQYQCCLRSRMCGPSVPELQTLECLCQDRLGPGP